MANRSTRALNNKKARIYKRESGICHYCGVLCNPFPHKGRNKHDATLDHVQTRMSGGGNEDQNLVLACLGCNNRRSCIPYDVFINKELWRPENRNLCAQISRLFAVGAQPVKDDKPVYILEMYTEDAEYSINVQNWGVFATAQAVHLYMSNKFPDAILNLDDDPGYIGYHFPEGHPLEDISFVANAWDLLTGVEDV